MNDIQPITLPGIDPRRPLVIAGPCSAETEEQVLDTARSLAAEGIRICRAGLWKPRTKPGGFEGVGAEGVAWLRRVKRETGMYTATEVATRKHVMAALEGGIDMIWIGARTTANPFAMQEIADALRGTDVPVLVKNPVSPDLELWIGAIERIYNAGIRRTRKLKNGLYYRLPRFFRVLCIFIFRYIFQLGFLDGVPGLIYHFMYSFMYRFLVDAKLYEAQKTGKYDTTITALEAKD